MADAVVIRDLVKVYRGVRALDGLDLAVPEGSVFGFLGPNGAGKTTTLRILAGLARPTSGSVTILGHDAGSAGARGVTGFLPDVPGFYDWMTAREFLEFAGRLFGMDDSVLAERVGVLLDLAGLAGVKTRVGGFSRGMRQRLGIAQALVNAPRLLMLDEPTSALDPIGRREVLEMVASLAGRTTVFFSTHVLADVERVCDTVAIIDRGKVVEQSGMAELKSRRAVHRVIVEVSDGASRLAESLAQADWVTALERDDESLLLTVPDAGVAGRRLPAILDELCLELRRFEPAEAGLEEVFVDLVHADGRSGA